MPFPLPPSPSPASPPLPLPSLQRLSQSAGMIISRAGYYFLPHISPSLGFTNWYFKKRDSCWSLQGYIFLSFLIFKQGQDNTELYYTTWRTISLITFADFPHQIIVDLLHTNLRHYYCYVILYILSNHTRASTIFYFPPMSAVHHVW